MKTHRLLLAAAFAVSFSGARADIAIDKADATPPHSTGAANSTVSPVDAGGGSAPQVSPEDARVAALKARFDHGRALESEGQLLQARTIFDGIIADAPDAKGSLLEAGKISFQLGEAAKADAYLTKLRALVPENAMVIETLIPVAQALKHDAQVEILIQKLAGLHTAGQATKPYFTRDRILLDGGNAIVVTQFFDYHQPPHYAWVADLLDAQGNLKRHLTVNYDPEVTATMRKDPKLAHAEQFLIVDNVVAAGHVTRLDVYQQFLSLPSYAKVRLVLMEIFANALKPIDSAPVPQATQ